MSPLRIPAFRNLWFGQAISQLGDAFYFVVFAFMTLKITGSAAMVGIVSALETLPYLLLGSYAGVLADRIDRRKIMLRSDQISAGLLAGLGLAVYFFDGKPPVAILMFTAATLSSARVFFMPARGAAVPALVPPDMLLKANALSSGTLNVTQLISLSISAGILALLYQVSPTWFFLSAVTLNMISFTGSAIFVSRLPKIPPDRAAIHDVHPLEDLRAGIAYVRGRHELWLMLGLQLLLNLMISPFFVVYLVANKQWFGDLPRNIAWLEFSFFLGMTIATVFVARLKLTRPGLGYIVSIVGVGLCVLMMGFTPNFWLFVTWNMLAGVFIPFGSIPMNTYMQLTVPDAYRGRVNSAWTTVSVGVQPIGLSLGGILVERAGIFGGFLTMGAGMAASGAIGLFDRQFRRLRMPEPAVDPPAEPVLAAEAC